MKEMDKQFQIIEQEVSQEQRLASLKESVYRFYLSKRDECKKQYDLAESPDISSIYETEDNEHAQNMLFPKVSVLVITANKYEKNVMHANIAKMIGQKLKRIKVNLCPKGEYSSETYAYYFCWHKYQVLHLEAQTTGSYTIGGAADLVRYAVENPYLYPTAIISFGICFGIDETRQTMGDTILSDKVYPYFMAAKVGETGLFVSDDNMFRINQRLRTKIKGEIIDSNKFKNLPYKTKFGNYITGEAVVSSLLMRDFFANTTTQDVLAGDMEGYGLFKECFSRNYLTPCLTVKSICDWGACKNFADAELFQQLSGQECTIDLEELHSIKDRLQAYATYNAFQVLGILLEHCIFDQSIYDQVVKKILKMQDDRNRIIHIRRLNSFVKQEVQQNNTDAIVSPNFMSSVCECLVNDGILQDTGGQNYLIINGGCHNGK